jgi:cytochrome c oxidase cbb3-type subunit 1
MSPIPDLPGPSGSARGLPTVDAIASTAFRRPLLFLFGSAFFWLLAGNFLSLIAALGLPAPDLCGGAAWAAYGRIAPAARTAWTVGGASLGALGIALFLAGPRGGKLSRALVWTGAALWNAALLGGVGGILRGESTGIPGLEMPRPMWTLLLAAYLLLALPMVGGLARSGAVLSVARLYLLGALAWFPVLLGVAGRTLLCAPVAGLAQLPIIAWFGQGFFLLWLAPVALAAFYHFIPERLGRPLRQEGLARAGFWAWMAVGGWTGAARLVDGPAPAWLASAGVAASIALLVPVLAVAAEARAALRGGAARDPACRFFLAAALALVVLGAEGFLTAFRTLNPVVRFTAWESARAALALYGVAGLAFLGACIAVVPRLAGREWCPLAARALRVHFWIAIGGLGLWVGALAQGGLLQGLGLLDPRVPFSAVVSLAAPFWWISAAALLVLFLNHLALAGLGIATLRQRPASEEKR